jgi:peptidyl-prolyl cis-trans isomerase C
VKKDLTIALIAILIIAAATFAIARVRPDLPLTPSQPYAEKAVAKTSAPKTGKVVMHVNGEAVTEDEFNAFVNAIPDEQRAGVMANPQGKRMVANEIAKLKLLEQEAARLGVADDPEIRRQLDMSNAQVLAVHALQRLVQPRVEQMVREEFEQAKKDAIELSQIAIAFTGGQYPVRDGSQRSPELAMQKANAVVARLKGGADFAQLARAESDDPQSAERGGSLGAVRREMLPPEIAAAIAAIKPGQISNPVRTPLGVHVFRYQQPTLESMRPTLQQQAQQRAMQETMQSLETRAKIEYEPSFFPPAPTQPQQPGVKLPGTR